MAENCYADAELRYTRWLEKFQVDRSRHAKARRANPDPAALDAELADALDTMHGLGYDKPELREATDLLWRGARMAETSCSLLGHKLANIIYMLEADDPGREERTQILRPHFRAFLDALTASGSYQAMCKTYGFYVVGARDVWETLPFCVLQSVVIGEPWGIDYDSKAVKLGSLEDLALRRVCLRLFARMAFLSAERALGRGETIPFMALFETDGRKLCPFGLIEMEHMVHPTNQAAFLHVIYLMVFMNRRFPAIGQLQHIADMEHASTVLSRPVDRYLYDCWGTSPKNQADNIYGAVVDPLPPSEQVLRLAFFLVPGVWKLLLEENLGHLLLKYCFMGYLEQPRVGSINQGTPSKVMCDTFCKVFFSSREAENALIRIFRYTGLASSSWICGEGGRFLLLELCRQRRRRVLQVTFSAHPECWARYRTLQRPMPCRLAFP